MSLALSVLPAARSPPDSMMLNKTRAKARSLLPQCENEMIFLYYSPFGDKKQEKLRNCYSRDEGRFRQPFCFPSIRGHVNGF